MQKQYVSRCGRLIINANANGRVGRGPARSLADPLVDKAALGRGEQISEEKRDPRRSERTRADNALRRKTTKVQLAHRSIWTFPSSSNTRIQHAHHVIAIAILQIKSNKALSDILAGGQARL